MHNICGVIRIVTRANNTRAHVTVTMVSWSSHFYFNSSSSVVLFLRNIFCFLSSVNTFNLKNIFFLVKASFWPAYLWDAPWKQIWPTSFIYFYFLFLLWWVNYWQDWAHGFKIKICFAKFVMDVKMCQNLARETIDSKLHFTNFFLRQ